MSIDLNIISFKELIEGAFGEPENNVVNFKMLQTIVYLLARQLGVLDRLVQVDFTNDRRPSPSQSSITVSEIKIKATATNKKIKPKDANERAIKGKEDPGRKKFRSSTSNDTSVQSRSPDLKTKYATQGWPYNPSLDDVDNTENVRDSSHNSPSEKNKDKNKATHKTKTSDKKIKRIANVMEYGNEQSSRFQANMESLGGKLTENKEDKWDIKSIIFPDTPSEIQPNKRIRDACHDEIRNPLHRFSDSSISEQKGNKQGDPESARFGIDVTLSITEVKSIIGNGYLNEKEVYKSDGKGLVKVNTVSEESSKIYRNFETNKQHSKNASAAITRIHKDEPKEFQNPEPYFPNEQEQRPGYTKETSFSISSTKEVEDLYGKQNNISMSQGNEKKNSQIETIKTAIFEKNKEYKESTYDRDEKQKENTSLKEDFISYIGSLEDIVSITEREGQQDRPKDKSYHNSSYDEIIYKPQRIYERNLSDDDLDKTTHFRSLSEVTCLEKSGLEIHKYTENGKSAFDHQKYYSFLERDRYDRSNSKSLRRSSSDEVISKINKYQEQNSDQDKGYGASNQSQPQEKKKTFDFNKYIKLNQPSFEVVISKEGKDQEDQDERIKEYSKAHQIKSKDNYSNKKPLYRSSEEELYKHYKEYRGEEKTLENENNKQGKQQRRMSKYQQFYQPSEELISQYNKSPFEDRHRGQSEPTEITQRSRRESSRRDKKLSLDNENRKDRDNLSLSIKDPREKDRDKSLPEEYTYKKFVSAQDDSEFSNKKRDSPSHFDNISTDKNSEKIRPDYNKDKQKVYDNAKNQPDGKINDKDEPNKYRSQNKNANSQERQTLSKDMKETSTKLSSDTYNQNMSLFEKLIHAIMSKCNRENGTFEQKVDISENVQQSRESSDKVSYSSLKDALLSKSPGYRRHKLARKRKHKGNKSDPRKPDYSEKNESNMKTGGVDYIKNKFMKKESEKRAENENTQDENQYPSSSDEEISDKFKKIKEFYTEISEKEKTSIKNWRYSKEDKDEKENALNRSVSEELIPRRIIGVGDESLAKDESQRKKGTEKRYPIELDSERRDKSLSRKHNNEEEKYGSSWNKPRYQLSSEEVISDRKNLAKNDQRDRLRKTGQESKGHYDDSLAKDESQRKKDTEKLDSERRDKGLIKKYNSEEENGSSWNKPRYQSSSEEVISGGKKRGKHDKRDRLRETGHDNKGNYDDVQTAHLTEKNKDTTNLYPTNQLLSTYDKLKQAIMAKCNLNRREDIEPRKDISYEAGENYVLNKSLGDAEKNQKETQEKREKVSQHRSSSKDTIVRRDESPDSRKDKVRQPLKTKENYSYRDRPKQYQSPSEEDLERSQIKSRKEGQAYLKEEQQLQSSSEELIKKRDKKQKERPDYNKVKSISDRSLPEDLRRRKDMQEYAEDESEEIIRKRGKIEEKIPDYKRSYKDSPDSKEYDDEGHSKKHQKSSEFGDSEPKGKRERREHSREQQPNQSSSEEIIKRPTGERKESLDINEKEERKGTRDYDYDSRDQPHDRLSSDETRTKKHRRRKKDPGHSKENSLIDDSETSQSPRSGYEQDDFAKDITKAIHTNTDKNDFKSDGYGNRPISEKNKPQLDKQREKSADNYKEKKLKQVQEYRDRPRDKRQYQSSSEEEVSEVERNLTKSHKSDMEKLKKETEEAIGKDDKGNSSQEKNDRHRSPTEELNYSKYTPQSRGLEYEQGAAKDQLHAKDIQDNKKQYKKSGVDAPAKDKQRRKKNREVELYNSSSDEYDKNEKNKQKQKIGEKLALCGYKETDPEEVEMEKIRLTQAILAKSSDVLIKKSLSDLDKEDLKSKLARQRDWLFAKCPGFKSESFLKRDNTLSYKSIIDDKINKSISEDESEDYDQNKIKSRSKTKDRAGMRRVKSFDGSSLDDLSKYESQIGALFSKSPGFSKAKLEEKKYFTDDDTQSYQKKDKQREESYDYETKSRKYRSLSKEPLNKEEEVRDGTTDKNKKVKHLHSLSYDEAIPKPKKRGQHYDDSEENEAKEAKKKTKGYDRPHKRILSPSHEERKKPSKEKEDKGLPESIENQINLSEKERDRFGSGLEDTKYDQGKEKLPATKRDKYKQDKDIVKRAGGSEKSKKEDDRSDETIVGKKTKDKYKVGRENLKEDRDKLKRDTGSEAEKDKYDTNQTQKRKTNKDKYSPDEHQRSSSGKRTLEDREISTSMASEPRKQEPLPSFSNLGDWQVDPSVIIIRKSKDSEILSEKERDRIGSAGLEDTKYDQGKDKITPTKRDKYKQDIIKGEGGSEKSKKEDDRSDETIVGKKTKDKYKVGREDLKEDKDKLKRDTRSQAEKDKYGTNQAQKRKTNKDKYSPNDSMGSIIEEGSHKYTSDESFKSEREQRRRKTLPSDDVQEKRKTKDKILPDTEQLRRDTLKSGIDSASSKQTDEYYTDKKDGATGTKDKDRRYSAQIDTKDEKKDLDTKLDGTKDLLRSSDSAETKRLGALKDSIESKDIEKEKDADSKKDGAKLKDGKSFELEKDKQVDNLKDSKKLKDSAKLDSITGDSQKSKQYNEDDGSRDRYEDGAKKQSSAISDSTKVDYAKHVKSEDLLVSDGQTGSKGGKKLDTHGVPLEVFEELREQELRVINQRADSREEPDREPTRMLSVPSAEKALAHSTKEGQKVQGKADTKAAAGKLGRKPSQESEGDKLGKRASITTGSRRPSQDIEEEKILVVERIPLDKEKAREYKEKNKGTPLAVVKLEEFEALAKEVKEIDARIRPPSRFSFPGNAELLEHIRNGASLTEAMAALQLSARIEAAENALENIIEMVTKLAADNPEVDIDKHGQAILKLPARQAEASIATSRPMDYLGFDALASHHKEPGAICREGCITKPEFDQEILKVQKELAKEIGESAKKNLNKIEVLAKNLRHLESKVEDAVHMGSRMSDLEDLVAGYSERINAMDTGLSVQMTSYQDQLTQMQHELEEGLENMAETLANAEGDPAAVAELHVKLNILQDDLVNTANIQSELEKNEQDVFVNLKDLFTQIEHLRETKADREEVEDALQNKAGLSALNGLISLEHFDALIGDMEAHIGKAYDKFNNQELIWQKAINDLVKELNEKTNLEIVLNLRDDINKKINMIMERISDLRNIVGEPKAFGTTKRINVGAECLSCKTPAQMEPEAKPSRMPAMKTSSASGGGPYMKEAGDACYPGYPIPHPLDARTHICNRYCGGSHTVLKNVTRAKSLPGAVTIKKWERPSPPGSVKKPLLVEDPSVRGPCYPCNIVPSTLEMSPKPSAPVKGRAVFDIEIRESDKCPCFNVEPELDSDLTFTG